MIALRVDLEYHRLVEIAARVTDRTFLVGNLVCIMVSISWLAHEEVCQMQRSSPRSSGGFPPAPAICFDISTSEMWDVGCDAADGGVV